MHRRWSVWVTSLLAMTATLLTAPPAMSAPPRFETIRESFSDHIEDFCGIPGFDVDSSVTFTSRLKIRTTRSGVAYFLENQTVDQTVTGVSSGRSVSIHSRVLVKDLKIVDNGDGTLAITQLLTGMSTLYGEDGKAVARDPGQVRLQLVIDTNGTPDVFDDDIEISSELIFGSTGRSDDFCAATFAQVG
jgi:hypothetical protein